MVTEAFVAITTVLNFSVPELVMVVPLLKVIVPAVGVNVPVTANVPATVAVAVAPVMVPLIFNPPELADP